MSHQDSSPKAKPKHLREPPPALFLGPPSQNASHVSLPGLPAAIPPVIPAPTSSLNPGRAPLKRQTSQRMPPSRTSDGAPESTVGSTLPRPALTRQQHESEGKKQADRTDALWAEMQGTLEEVELSAVNGTHVFGPEHGKALDELRAAQIGLAQAWARSEADEVVEAVEKESKAKGMGLGSEGRSALEAVGSTAAGSGRPGSSNGGIAAAERRGSKLEEETEADVLLARKRREANDRYFQRVNAGVLDVVAKLEEVAAAMRAVEQESRDIWGESESAGTSINAE